MQTMNYSKWIYKFQILGLLSLLTACEPPSLEQARVPSKIQLAKAAATPEVQATLDTLNSLGLRNHEIIQKTQMCLNSINDLAQSGVNAQKALDLLNTAKDNGDSNLSTLKGTKKTEANDALGKLGAMLLNMQNEWYDLCNPTSTEETMEYNNKLMPVVINGSVPFNSVNQLARNVTNIWEKVRNFQ